MEPEKETKILINNLLIDNVYVTGPARTGSSSFYYSIRNNKKTNIFHGHDNYNLQRIINGENNLIICGIRDPIKQILSNIYRHYNWKNPLVNVLRFKKNGIDKGFINHYIDKNLLNLEIDEIINIIKKSKQYHNAVDWYNDFFDIVNIDLKNVNFNKEKGYSILKKIKI